MIIDSYIMPIGFKSFETNNLEKYLQVSEKNREKNVILWDLPSKKFGPKLKLFCILEIVCQLANKVKNVCYQYNKPHVCLYFISKK